MKHLSLFLIVVASLFLAGCVASTSNTTTPTGNVTATAGVKEFTLTANNFAWDPATITVNKGDTVIIHGTSADVEHGFALPAFKVNQKLPVGETTTFQFVADQAGEFPFFCNVFCGAGHRDMTGTLVVK